MPGVTAASTWAFAFVSRFGGQNGINVRYFKADTITGAPAPEQEFANAVSAVMAFRYVPMLCSAAIYRGITMRELGTLAPILYLSTSGQASGSSLGDPLPAQTAGLITLRGPGPLRKNHGRIYVPFPSEADNATNGGVSVTYASNAINLGLEFVGTRTYTLAPSGATVAGRWYIAGNRGTAAPVFIESSNPRGFWATQRRRSLLNRSDLVIV